jgi:hypothetical protein
MLRQGRRWTLLASPSFGPLALTEDEVTTRVLVAEVNQPGVPAVLDGVVAAARERSRDLSPPRTQLVHFLDDCGVLFGRPGTMEDFRGEIIGPPIPALPRRPSRHSLRSLEPADARLRRDDVGKGTVLLRGENSALVRQAPWRWARVRR